MLDYAGTTSGSTTGPVLRSCTLDQLEVVTSLHPLSGLLEHPEFQEGLAGAQEAFLDSYEPAPLTEEEMIEEIEMNLSRRITERCQHLTRILGGKPPSYLRNLGFVVGLINQGLAYAQ